MSGTVGEVVGEVNEVVNVEKERMENDVPVVNEVMREVKEWKVEDVLEVDEERGTEELDITEEEEVACSPCLVKLERCEEAEAAVKHLKAAVSPHTCPELYAF